MKNSEQETSPLYELFGIMKKLRSPEGCPWDRKQTHLTLKKYFMEECAEYLDAADENDADGMCEELGDILMHVMLNSVIAEEDGRFSIDDVARCASEKMMRRHPHVFGEGVKVEHADEVVGIWEDIKKEEKKKEEKDSVLDGVPRNLPSLLRAEQVQKKAAAIGFDWEKPEQITEKIAEELDELREALKKGDTGKIDEEIGDLLFAVANLTRFRKGPSAEELLSASIRKFISRFEYIEEQLAARGKSPEESSIGEMEELWNESKRVLSI